MTVIRDLLSYRLHVVANLLSRSAELRYRREFGVSLWEWRTVALLGGAAEPLTLNELARSAGIDKSQMSRVVSGLAGRHIVLRAPHASDARSVRLELSRAGRKLYKGLIDAAGERDAAFRRCLTDRDEAALARILAKLADEARSMVQAEREPA